MPSIDVRKKRIGCKIVYYGPGLSGKTANLRYIHDHLSPENRGRLMSVAVKTEGNLYIDLLPVRFGKLGGFDVAYNLCSTPGKALYNKTRQLVLKATDGVVFVADSRPERMDANVDSLENLLENLEAHDLRLRDMPNVIQYNKRDLPDVMPVSEMRSKLNIYGGLEFEASTVTGQGVMETLKAIIDASCREIQQLL